MRLIDADVAKKAVHKEFDECLVWDESGEHTANVIEEILESLPTVEAEPVRHGKWINREHGMKRDGRHYPFWERYECSVCGAKADESDYCPNCGAKMDGEREEE